MLMTQSKLSTLESRRSSSRMKMLFDLIYDKKHLNKVHLPVRQRCVNVKFKTIHGSIRSYESSFFPDVVRNWNNLPVKVMNELDENKFLKGLRALEI